MTKVVFINGFKDKASDNGHKGVVKKRVRNAEGEVVQVSSVDVRSATFGEDLRYIFSKNVAAARRENIAATGRADGVVKKR